MHNNCYVPVSCHGTLAGAQASLMVHATAPAQLIYFLPLNNELGLLITESNFPVETKTPASFSPFAMVSGSNYALSHFVNYVRTPNGLAAFKHYSTHQTLSAVPGKNNCEGFFQWRQQIREWESFYLAPCPHYNVAASVLKASINAMLMLGMPLSSKPWQDILLYDLITNYLPVSYLGAHNLDNFNWTSQLENIYREIWPEPLFAREKDCKGRHTEIGCDDDSIQDLVLGIRNEFIKDSPPAINNVPLRINLIKKIRMSRTLSKKHCCVIATADNVQNLSHI